MQTIWVNEQLDPSGLLYACIACCDKDQAMACRESFESNLTIQQKQSGWSVRTSQISSWDQVPAGALKLG